MLGAAYALAGQVDKAREVARQALDISTDVRYLLGIGWSHQALGQVAWTQGAFDEAGRHLGEALQAFANVHSRFEMGRTHFFLASLAYALRESETAGMHLKEAHSLFTALRVPKYIERTEHVARKFGFPPFT
jgi:tetratricopeptide (TPR) repeat protein